MIVNIPITVDENVFEHMVGKDLDKKVDEYIHDLVENAIKGAYGYNRDSKFREIIRDRVDVYFENHKDEITDIIAQRIYERTVNRKKIKEVVNEK